MTTFRRNKKNKNFVTVKIDCLKIEVDTDLLEKCEEQKMRLLFIVFHSILEGRFSPIQSVSLHWGRTVGPYGNYFRYRGYNLKNNDCGGGEWRDRE